jgi:hypothetical protein
VCRLARGRVALVGATRGSGLRGFGRQYCVAEIVVGAIEMKTHTAPKNEYRAMCALYASSDTIERESPALYHCLYPVCFCRRITNTKRIAQGRLYAKQFFTKWRKYFVLFCLARKDGAAAEGQEISLIVI